MGLGRGAALAAGCTSANYNFADSFLALKVWPKWQVRFGHMLAVLRSNRRRFRSLLERNRPAGFLEIGDTCDLSALYLRLIAEDHEVRIFIAEKECHGIGRHRGTDNFRSKERAEALPPFSLPLSSSLNTRPAAGIAKF